MANKVAQELLGASIGPAPAAPAAAAPVAAAPAAAAASPAVASSGDHAALEQKLRAWIPNAQKQGLDPVKLLPELKGVFTQGLALGDAYFLEVVNKVLGGGVAAAPTPAAAAPAAAAPPAAASADKSALEQKLRQWIPNARSNGLNPATMLP